MREHWNRLSDLMERRKLTCDDVKTLARKSTNGNERAAALRLMRTWEQALPGDFEDVLEGKKSLVELEADGVDTTVVKKITQKSRVVKNGNDDPEEIIERQIEFHDRAASSQDAIINHTDGSPIRRAITAQFSAQDVGQDGVDYALYTQEELAELIAMNDRAMKRLAAKPVESLPAESQP